MTTQRTPKAGEFWCVNTTTVRVTWVGPSTRQGLREHFVLVDTPWGSKAERRLRRFLRYWRPLVVFEPPVVVYRQGNVGHGGGL